MNKDVNHLLRRLSTRRHGVDRLTTIAMEQQSDVLKKQLLGESYEKRAAGKPYTRYALGAMDQVDPDYTRISVETAGRVQNQLDKKLAAEGIGTTCRLQGSVPLNVHIRGVSDVDLLVIETGTLFYATSGVKAQRQAYYPARRDGLSVLSDLRKQSEVSLKASFPAAIVETSNAKAIKLYGGSLPRPVDVVPALWWDTATYQSTAMEHDRGVSVYHKFEHRSIDNLPFLHIKRVTDRCDSTIGGIRKAIRLCKNVKADGEEDGVKIDLSSYEIAGLIYHADQTRLRCGVFWELGILAETQRHLDWLVRNPTQAAALKTPDESRLILESSAKHAALASLSGEMNKLLANVAREHNSALYMQESLDASRATISELVIT